MALPFLPPADIPGAFSSLQQRATNDALTSLVSNISRQWISSQVFPIRSWSIYRQTVRTNNDVEGWHHRLITKAGHSSLGLYRLVPLLRKESELVTLRVHSDNLFRDVRRSTTTVEKKLEAAWDSYDAQEISASHFLKICGTLYAPCEL